MTVNKFQKTALSVIGACQGRDSSRHRRDRHRIAAMMLEHHRAVAIDDMLSGRVSMHSPRSLCGMLWRLC
jgi:hypothetical protein